MKKFVFIISLTILLGINIEASADTVGQKQKFYIDSSYDLSGRKEITAVLVGITPKIYFYIDENWWNFTIQNEFHQAISQLGDEFESTIYPKLTSIFGPEWNPGIDKDSRITVLIHSMKEGAGGYFRSNDEYPKVQVSDSNEREMVYLNSEYITNPLAKSFLAHEFVHLITFNQKENTHDIAESTWLNEARAEYASTLIGYDDNFKAGYLEKRIQTFIDESSDSIIDWRGEKADYGVINLFSQYLVDHYGLKILVDSLRSDKIGVESINYALEKNSFEEDFSQIFLNWTIAVLINDCNYGNKYCYLNPNLKDFHISPRINFLPLSGESTLTLTDLTKAWTGNWYKIIGGKGKLKFSFIGGPDSNFQIPFITRNQAGNYNVKFLGLDENKKGQVYIENFGQDTTALFLIPSLNGSEKNEANLYYAYSWSATIERPEEDQTLIPKLLARISEIKAEIEKVQARISAILAGRGPASTQTYCQKIEENLYFGLMNNQNVRCLQQFLKSQGQNIYPEGLITGNFLSLTKEAVIRFQEKYIKDILMPFGLTKGTGFVGLATRAKLNELSSSK